MRILFAFLLFSKNVSLLKSFTFLIFLNVLNYSSNAATIMVTSNNGGDIAGSLHAAIDQANGNAEDDIITFSITGTITLTESLPNITSNITINGPGASSLTIDGIDMYKLFQINSGNTVFINDLTLTNGIGGFSTSFPAGGTILNFGNTTVNDCIMTSSVVEFGGAVFNENGTINLNNCTISNNESKFISNSGANDGAGIYNFGSGTGTATANIDNCTISNNIAEGFGGGIVNDAFGNSSSADMTIINSTISNNVAQGSAGSGGINNRGGASLMIDNTTIQGNQATGNVTGTILSTTPNGGGIRNMDVTSSLTITNSTVNNNFTTLDGGGVHSHNAIFDATNCTFSNNSANRFSGGLDIIGTNGSTVLKNCTVAFNTGDADNTADPNEIGDGVGGIGDVSDNVTLRNTIVADNIDATNTAPDLFGDIASLGFNVIGDNTNTGGTNGLTTMMSDITNMNAQLMTLGNNGGDTQTIGLNSNSPAINIITNGSAPTNDQRGFGRNGNPDSGAFEFNGIDLSVPAITVALFGTTSVNEDGATTGNTLTYQFSRTGATDAALSVNFSIVGDNLSNDFNVGGATSYDTGSKTGVITFPISSSTVNLIITVLDDSLVETNEEVVVKIEP